MGKNLKGGDLREEKFMALTKEQIKEFKQAEEVDNNINLTIGVKLWIFEKVPAVQLYSILAATISEKVLAHQQY
tara:strand:- start:196 stop:417 length:222 start_codon:yes stop_codon:yes gene_type:complete